MRLKKDYTVIYKIGDIIDYAKVTTGPEITDITQSKNYPSINKFMFDSSSINLSEHNGDLEMKLCDKCDYKNYEKTFCPNCGKTETGDKK